MGRVVLRAAARRVVLRSSWGIVSQAVRRALASNPTSDRRTYGHTDQPSCLSEPDPRSRAFGGGIVGEGEERGADEAPVGDEIAVNESAKLASLAPDSTKNSLAPREQGHRLEARRSHFTFARYRQDSNNRLNVRSGGLERSPPHREQDPRDTNQAKNINEGTTKDRSVNQTITQGESESQRDIYIK